MEHKQDVGHKEPPHLRGKQQQQGEEENNVNEIATDEDISFFHDFVAGGVAGSASVVVGHPFDTIKVRMQTTKAGTNSSFISMATSYGGFTSLFRGMAAPLSTACIVNALIFSSYGWSSRLFDQYIEEAPSSPTDTTSGTTTSNRPVHDSAWKAFTCGSFAGFVQALVICPMEHIKCRLQVQSSSSSSSSSTSSTTNKSPSSTGTVTYKGPVQVTRSIFNSHGIPGLYRGWNATVWREVPAFGVYFAFYDYSKDKINAFFSKLAGMDDVEAETGFGQHSHTWLASALAGGSTGALTWAMIYPIDVIKTKIQTSPMDIPADQQTILRVGHDIIKNHGWRYMFRGMNVTLFRAIPVNATIFPVYEFTLMQVAALEY